MKPSITIIGAGVSGLASAYWLSQAGHEVTLFEATSQAGGVIRSERREGFLIEHGPNSLLDTTPVLRELFEGIGRSDSLIQAKPAAKNR